MDVVRNGYQPDLLDGLSEAQHYHDHTQFGTFAILRKDHHGRVSQRTYPLRELAQVIESLDTSCDTWISQAEFSRFNRRVVNLLRTGVLFCDLDFYNTPFVQYDADAMASAVLMRCADEGIPEPSIILSSGKGLQLKWLLTKPVPAQALPRWNAVQKHLGELLVDMGADACARDASRVLRLVGTVNSKNGEIARVIHVSGSVTDPQRHSFDQMAALVLPHERMSHRPEAPSKQSRRQPLKLIQGGYAGNLRVLSGGQLSWDRLHDLRKLVEIRGGVSEGERMLHLFWQLNFAALSGQVHSAVFWSNARELASQLDPGWGARLSELSTLYQKAKAYNAGERIEFQGKTIKPLYTPRNQKLIDLFQITDDEQQQLRTIITRELAAERHAERERARRRAAGAQSREDYLKTAEGRRTQARALREQGLSIRKIASEMSTSASQVQRWLG